MPEPIVLSFHLTPKEEETASLVAQGYTNKQIAAQLGVSGSRVRILISAIAYKANLDASRDERVQVALWWHRTATVAKRYSA